MKGDKRMKKKILGFTAFFIAICVVIGVRPVIGFCVLAVSLIDLIIYRILSGSKEKKSLYDLRKILPQKDLEQSKKLLRYATAALSFISLLTTANGLETFVFAKNQKWLAYLASFAVQSILVVFSLLLCHIYYSINEVKTFSERGKRFFLMALTSFFAVAFLVSSSFSFVYIANNAYADSWSGDSDVMIENYLINETNLLRKENERIGQKLLKDMQEKLSSDNGLQSSVDKYQEKQKTRLVKMLNKKENKLHKCDKEIKEVKINIPQKVQQSWKSRYPASADEIDELVKRFDKRCQELLAYIKEYNKIKKEYNKKEFENTSNWEKEAKRTKTYIDRLKQLMGKLQSLETDCSKLKIYVINDDIIIYSSDLVKVVTDFRSFVKGQKTKLESLRREMQNAADGFIAGNGNGKESLSKQIEDIKKQIYQLQVVDSLSESTVVDNQSGDENISISQVDEVRKDMSNLLEDFSNNDVSQEEDVEKLVDLKDKLGEYYNYCSLKSNIERFSSNNLKKTYLIRDEEISNSQDDNTDDGSSSAGKGDTDNNFITVNTEQWKRIRDNDFHEFFALLKMLPNEGVAIDDVEHEADAEESNYTAGVLKEANKIRRDLLGQITDFERAINYFLYDFKAMAFFSAFIALFFDLGAFLTGCFLYGTRHIDAKNS